MELVKKKHKTAKEVRDQIVAESHCRTTWQGVHVVGNISIPAYFEIEFSGLAAKIPSTKNRRIPIRGNRSIPNHTTEGFLKALDHLYGQLDLGPWEDLYYGNIPLFLLVISCKRSAACDLDNVMTSVRDWLESPEKNKGGRNRRGWGIGLVYDDRAITGFCVPSKLLGMEAESTRIILRPLELVRGDVLGFCAGIQI